MKFKILLWIDHWISSWMDIICGLLSVVTLTMFRPSWDMNVRVFFAKTQMKMRMKQINNVN